MKKRKKLIMSALLSIRNLRVESEAAEHAARDGYDLLLDVALKVDSE